MALLGIMEYSKYMCISISSSTITTVNANSKQEETLR